MKTIFLIGVSGSGKTSVGLELAKRTGREFRDGDDFHSAENREKMASGEPLVDADREPWLISINQYCKKFQGNVVACSALKAKYRNVLRQGCSCCFVHLNVNRETLENRLKNRENHFMPCSLLNSQFEAWEDTKDEPDVITVDCTDYNVFDVADRIIQTLQE
ncbi:unnamed protein product [Auanema sp. JU1783]|nr:unnamed protein product [Auanema sp. JU1783]